MSTTDSRTGRTLLHPNWILSPLPTFAAREVDPTQVIKVKESMRHHGVHAPRVVVLAWECEVKDAGYDPTEVIHLDVTDPNIPFPMYAVIGDHSKEAVKQLHNQFPRNRQYQTISVETFLISKKSNNSLSLAQSVGTLDNTLMNMQKANTTWDMILQMHRRFDHLQMEHETKRDFRLAWRQYRTTCSANMGVPDNSVGSMMCLAQIQGPLWDNIEKIFKGEVTANPNTQFRIPSSHGHFVSMSDIPYPQLEEWTNQIVNGEMTTKQFLTHCRYYKKVLRVKKEIVEYVGIKFTGYDVETWEELVEKLPFFGKDTDWVKKLISWCSEVAREKLSPSVKEALEGRVEMEINARLEETPVSDLFGLDYCLHILFQSIALAKDVHDEKE
jgi:hypothetical protein